MSNIMLAVKDENVTTDKVAKPVTIKMVRNTVDEISKLIEDDSLPYDKKDVQIVKDTLNWVLSYNSKSPLNTLRSNK